MTVSFDGSGAVAAPEERRSTFSDLATHLNGRLKQAPTPNSRSSLRREFSRLTIDEKQKRCDAAAAEFGLP